MVQLLECIIKAKPKICIFRHMHVVENVLNQGKVKQKLKNGYLGSGEGRNVQVTFRLSVMFRCSGGMVVPFHFIRL